LVSASAKHTHRTHLRHLTRSLSLSHRNIEINKFVRNIRMSYLVRLHAPLLSEFFVIVTKRFVRQRTHVKFIFGRRGVRPLKFKELLWLPRKHRVTPVHHTLSTRWVSSISAPPFIPIHTRLLFTHPISINLSLHIAFNLTRLKSEENNQLLSFIKGGR
jgi:hypothetical protein